VHKKRGKTSAIETRISSKLKDGNGSSRSNALLQEEYQSAPLNSSRKRRKYSNSHSLPNSLKPENIKETKKPAETSFNNFNLQGPGLTLLDVYFDESGESDDSEFLFEEKDENI